MNEYKTIFVGTAKEFKEEFEKLVYKYGISMYLLVFREIYEENIDEYHYSHSEIDTDFLEYLEGKYEDMRDRIDA